VRVHALAGGLLAADISRPGASCPSVTPVPCSRTPRMLPDKLCPAARQPVGGTELLYALPAAEPGLGAECIFNDAAELCLGQLRARGVVLAARRADILCVQGDTGAPSCFLG